MRIHVINLDRSSDRLAEFTSTNGHLGNVSRFPAVDGQKLDFQSAVGRGLVGADILSTYSMGAVGLAMSHITLWDAAIETGRTLTICEDDAIFNSRFDIYAADVVRELPSGWDVISWGWNFDLFLSFEMLPGVSYCLSLFDQAQLRENIDQFQQQAIKANAFKLIWGFGTPCYTVTPKGARLLRSKCLPLRPTITSFPQAGRLESPYWRNVGIDLALNNVWSQINAYVSFPPLVVTKNDISRSTLGREPQKISGQSDAMP